MHHDMMGLHLGSPLEYNLRCAIFNIEWDEILYYRACMYMRISIIVVFRLYVPACGHLNHWMIESVNTSEIQKLASHLINPFFLFLYIPLPMALIPSLSPSLALCFFHFLVDWPSKHFWFLNFALNLWHHKSAIYPFSQIFCCIYRDTNPKKKSTR